MPRGKDGSIIGDAVAPTGGASGVASGIWTMSEVHKYKTEGIWPTERFFMTATGGVNDSGDGTIIDTDYKYHVFTGTDDFIVTAIGVDPTYGNKVQYMIIAGGGGGGGGYYCAGGGAGGHLNNGAYDSVVTVGTYECVVGDGGAGGNMHKNPGVIGGTSSFNSISTTGGGPGSAYNGDDDWGDPDGGSGGGSAGSGASGTTPTSGPGSAVSGQGYAGGNGYYRSGGGGGGASMDSGIWGIGGDGGNGIVIIRYKFQ